jgi:transcriptional regulator with XRE-family HTH domain
METVGARIRAARERAVFGQAELARAARISVNALWLIERGLREPRATTIRRIAAALAIDPHELVVGTSHAEVLSKEIDQPAEAPEASMAAPTPDAQPSPFASPRQGAVYRELLRFGPGPALFYLDACRLRQDPGDLTTVTHLVNHLLREVDSAIREILDTAVSRGAKLPERRNGACETGDNEGRHREVILNLMRALDINEDGPIGRAWLRLPGTKKVPGLARRAHRDSLSQPRPVTEEMRTFWDEMDQVFEVVLDGFNTKLLAESYAAMDELLTRTTPGPKTVKELMRRVPQNPVTLEYFCERAGVAWLTALESAGFFEYPESLDRDHGVGEVGPLWWAPSGYLARTAREFPDRSKQILRIINSLPDTVNYLVLLDCVNAALHFPGPVAAGLVPRIPAWLERADSMLLPHHISLLMERLAREGQPEAVEVARPLLTLVESPVSGRDISSAVSPRFETWEYRATVRERLPAVVLVAPLEALTMLLDVLDDAVHKTARTEDGTITPPPSHHWLEELDAAGSRIEGYEKPIELLADALRDAAITAVESGSVSLSEVVEMLEGRGVGVFRRLALVILHRHGDQAPDLVARYLTDRSLWDDPEYRHEYRLLLHHRFGDLNRARQQVVLKWIEVGPPRRLAENVYRRVHGREPTDDEVAEYAREWQVEKLGLIAEHLTGKWRRWYGLLADELGEPAIQLHRPPVEVRWGSESPLTPSAMAALSLDDLIEHLRTFRGTESLIGPNAEGLAATLQQLATAEPDRFAPVAERFTVVAPTYISALLSGLWDAGRQGHVFSWQRVVELCSWAARQREPGDESPTSPTGWMRRKVADLLVFGLAEGDAQIPINLREQVREALLPLLDDPDPSPDTEAEHARTAGWIERLALNSTRARALQAAIFYAWWVRSHAHPPVPQGLDGAPEAREVLDRHLSSEVEPSLAVHSIYGQWFPTLTVLDRTWAVQNIGRIFPSALSKENIWEAAWAAYLRYNGVYVDVFQLLIPQYQRAVERLGEVGDLEGDDRANVTGHLLGLYEHSYLDLHDETGLIDAVFVRAQPALRKHLLAERGRHLLNSTESLHRAQQQRLAELWEWRLDRLEDAGGSEDRQEVGAFGWWFASGKMDDEWAIKQLGRVLEITPHVELEERVVERLAALVTEFPEQCVLCLDFLVRAKSERDYLLQDWRDAARTIIAAGLAVDDEAIRATAISAVNLLVRLRHTEFLSLLQK